MEKIKTLQNVALYSVSPLNPKQNLLFLLFVSFIILSLLSLILILFSDWLMLENAPHKYLKKRVFLTKYRYLLGNKINVRAREFFYETSTII